MEGRRDVYATLQLAQQASSDGDTVVVSAGVSTGRFILSRNIYVVGAGIGETILEGSMTVDFVTNGSVSGITVACTAPHDGYGILVEASENFLIDDVETYGCHDAGISIQGLNTNVDVNRALAHHDKTGVEVTDESYDTIVSNSLMRGNTHHGVRTAYNIEGNQLLFNTMVGNGFGAGGNVAGLWWD